MTVTAECFPPAHVFDVHVGTDGQVDKYICRHCYASISVTEFQQRTAQNPPPDVLPLVWCPGCQAWHATGMRDTRPEPYCCTTPPNGHTNTYICLSKACGKTVQARERPERCPHCFRRRLALATGAQVITPV